MGILFTWRSAALILFCLLISLFTCNPTQAADGFDFGLCKLMFCGKGTCQASGTGFLGFGCNCDPGWKKLKVGVDIELPPCILPNCTVDMQCGNGSLITPPIQLPKDVSDPCLLSFCGDGTCERIGSGFKCQCNEGSANLLNDPKMICLKKCALGADCNGIDLGFGDPPNGPTPPAQQNTGPASTGSSGGMLNYSRELQMLTVMILATIFHKWI